MMSAGCAGRRRRATAPRPRPQRPTSTGPVAAPAQGAVVGQSAAAARAAVRTRWAGRDQPAVAMVGLHHQHLALGGSALPSARQAARRPPVAQAQSDGASARGGGARCVLGAIPARRRGWVARQMRVARPRRVPSPSGRGRGRASLALPAEHACPAARRGARALRSASAVAARPSCRLWRWRRRPSSARERLRRRLHEEEAEWSAAPLVGEVAGRRRALVVAEHAGRAVRAAIDHAATRIGIGIASLAVGIAREEQLRPRMRVARQRAARLESSPMTHLDVARVREQRPTAQGLGGLATQGVGGARR